MPPEKSGGRRGSKPMSDLRDKFSNPFDGTIADTANSSSEMAEDASTFGTGATSDPASDAGSESYGAQASETSTPGDAGGIASGIRQFVKDTTYEQLGSQKQRATEGLGSIAQAVRSATQPLRDSGQGKTADYINTAADQIDQLSSTLRERDLQQLLNELESFARRQPAVFIGTAFGVGLLAARFLKSSSQRSASRASFGGGSSWDPSNPGSKRAPARDRSSSSLGEVEGGSGGSSSNSGN